MQILLNILLLLVGFVLLIKGADVFVDGAVGVSRKLKIPVVIIGLTVVAFGTSAPEAAVSVAAAVSGSNGIAAGNIIGSNIFNLMVVAGSAAIFSKLPVSKTIIKKDYPFMTIITVAMLVLFLTFNGAAGKPGYLSRIDGIILLAFFAFFLFYTIRGALNSRKDMEDSEPDKLMSGLSCAIYIIAGIIAIVIGGELVVDNASSLATAMGMSDTLVGLTIVALGTSLPELVTSIVASKKGENDIAMGNVVGSNIFNTVFVLGMSSAISPIVISQDIIIDTVIFIAMTVCVAIPMYKNKSLDRKSGIFMISGYIAYLAYIIIRNYY